jgi:hypothetical protein
MRRRPHAIEVVILGAIMASALIWSPGTAGAHHGVDSIYPSLNYQLYTQCSEGGICQGDSSVHYVNFDGLGPALRQATSNTLYNSYDTTDLTIRQQRPAVTDGPDETDVIYRLNDGLGMNTWGRAFCDDDSPSDPVVCDQFYVEYHGDKICPGNECYDASFHETLACHETGHTVGLLHGENATPRQDNEDADFRCMRTDVLPDDPRMGTHNVQQVNSVY